MLLDHNKFFSGEEATEAAVVRLVRLIDVWDMAFPFDALGTGKELFHQGCLTAELNLDMTVTEARWAAIHAAVLEVADQDASLGIAFELYKAVHGLASRALHDDVDGVVGCPRWLVNETGTATDCCDNLVLSSTVWDLGQIISTGLCYASGTSGAYVADLDDTPGSWLCMTCLLDERDMFKGLLHGGTVPAGQISEKGRIGDDVGGD